MPHNRRLGGYVVLTVLMILCWTVSMPAWSWMFRVILNVPEPEKNVELAMTLFPFYIAFMAGDLLTSVMYGLGLTNYIALKSVIGNLVMGGCFSLSLLDLLPLSLLSVSLMFGSGLLLGCLTVSAMYFRSRRGEKVLV